MPGSAAVGLGSQQAQARSSTSCPIAAWPACRSGQSLGSRSPECSLQTFPGPKVGGPYGDAPGHVPHAQREPTEAAHDEGVGGPCPSPRPPDPEFTGSECAWLTDPPFSASAPRAKDMKNKLGIFRRRNESPGAQPTGKADKVMKSFK